MDNDEQKPSNPPEAPDKEKMDQIRRRRLEKLSGAAKPKSTNSTGEGSAPSPSATSSPAAATLAKVADAPKPKFTVSKAPTPASSSSPNPFTKLSSNPTSVASTPTVRNKSERGTLKRPRAKPGEQTIPRAPTQKQATPSNEEDIDEYSDKILGQIFRITLNPQQDPNATHKLTYLPNLRNELEEENAPIKITKDKLDSALLEAASAIPANKSVLDYLLPCWKRTMKASRGLRGYAGEKDQVLKEAKRLCMSHCIFAVEMPELYGRNPNPNTDSLVPYFIHEADNDRGICPDFLIEAVSRFEEDDSVKPMLTKAIAGLSYQLSNISMSGNYKPYITAFKQIALFPVLVTAIAEDPLFQMATSAPGIEKLTTLGPLFRISPIQPDVSKDYFSSPKTMDRRSILNMQEALRTTLQAHQRDLLDIINLFVRAGPVARSRTLDWFAYIMNTNHMRRALRPDATQLSSDGFLMNVTVVLDGLCEPFMDTTFEKVARIDVDYLRRHPRIDIKDETKLNADQNASDEYYKTELEGTSNFITEVFFLTLAAHHYGSEATNGILKSLDKDIKYLSDKIAELEAERPKFVSNPINMARFETQLRRFTDVLDRAMQSKYAIEAILLDKPMQTKSLLFMRYVTVWLLRIASETGYNPDETIKLPLKAKQPDAFRFLPEYVLEDIVGNFNFISRFLPEVMSSAVGQEVIVLAVTFLTNSDYVKNPYLKAKLVSLLFHGTWPVYHQTKGILGDMLTSTKFANDHLLHALMKFYIEVESTGAHTQFYDKFNIRFEIFQVVKCIWSNDVYKLKLKQESRTNTEFFLRFVNLLLNDATYVLDEALTKFPKIHDLQGELNPHHQPPLTAEERAAKEEELSTAESQAQSYMQLTNETVSMMKLFTENLSASFTMPEIVDRVAAMLDYTLDTIVGPKSNNLKVENPDKYKFMPRMLLGEFVDIYLNLGVSERFVEAVARDGRSYKPINFENASRIVARFTIRPPEKMQKWNKLVERFAKAKEIEDRDEGDLGEIPEEFEDPLLATLMEDPVILPISRAIVDRSTIRSHLLSDPHDPFNRSPLKIEDVIPATELKQRIDTWRDDMRQKAKLEREMKTEVDIKKDDKMDVTEG